MSGPRRVAALATAGGELRVVVFDDGRRVRVDAEEVARHRLAAGEVVEPRLIARLEARDAYLRARERALRLLARRPRSIAEVRSRLMRHRIPRETLRAVIADLTAEGYLDDLAFAKSWVTARLAARAYGIRRLRWELQQKGVATAVIDQAVREAGADEDLAGAQERSASALAQRRLRAYRRLAPDQQARRIAALLERRGFSPSTIIRTVRTVGKHELPERDDG